MLKIMINIMLISGLISILTLSILKMISVVVIVVVVGAQVDDNTRCIVVLFFLPLLISTITRMTITVLTIPLPAKTIMTQLCNDKATDNTDNDTGTNNTSNTNDKK